VTLPRTPSQTVGPYYEIGLCRRADNELDPEGAPLLGRLLDGQGEPIGDGMIEVWDASGRRWGRCGTDGEGRFSFRVPRETGQLEVYVFARGLLRHQWTRVYLRDEDDALLSRLERDERETLLARPDDRAMRFDIRMQGERATVFFRH
jgi:protocatechuate 3,4-dioxygenase alpha subunit